MTIPMLFQTFISILAIYILFRSASVGVTPKSRYFVLLALNVFFYATGYLLELDSHSLEAAYYAQRVQYYGVSFFAVVYYLFIRDYSDRPIHSRLTVALLLIFPVITLLLVNAYPDSTLYFRYLSFRSDPTPHLVVQRGIIHHLHVYYSLLFITLSVVEIYCHFPTHTLKERQKRGIFLAATCFPHFSIIYFAMDRFDIPMQFGSAALVISMLILGYYIMHHRAEDWLPYARQSIVEHLNDGFVLIDNDNHFIDSNEIACKYFPEMRTMKPGTPITRIPGFPDVFLDKDCTSHEFTVSTEGKTISLRSSTTPIRYHSKIACTCILLYDITEVRQLMDELEELATHDSLTNLLNRTTFFRLASRDFNLHIRTRQAACVLMLDIDHFKSVNDRFGHPFGDTVLILVSSLIQERLRHTDIGGRYGGEEFSIFLPATDLNGASRVADDIRRSIESAPFIVENTTFFVTISIGIASLNPNRHDSLEDLLADADKALYAAKNHGRNRIMVAK